MFIGYILIGFIAGMITCAFEKKYKLSSMVGATLLGVIGALEGKLLLSFFSEQGNIYTSLMSFSIIISMSFALLLLKKILFFERSSVHTKDFPSLPQETAPTL